VHYYTFNIGDYRKDTVHLSRLEHSIYRDLIDWYYLDEKPIPLETDSVSRRLRLVSQEEKDSLIAVLQDFFELSEDGWRHKRIDQDINHYHGKCEVNKVNGARGGRPRKNPIGFESQANAKRSESENNPNQEPITNNQEPVITLPKGRESESWIPPCPHQEIVDLFHNTLPELPKVIVWNKAREGYLRARWREVAVEKGWKSKEEGIEYFRNFFGFVRNSKFLMGKVSGNGKRPFECELEWLLRPNNFVKVIEGKYHAA
jgi:uncharacterized protein YdaU (DUF1376 family)